MCKETSKQAMFKFVLAIALGLTSLACASANEPDFSGCRFRIKEIPQSIKLIRPGPICSFILSSGDNKRPIIGNLIWRHELSDSNTPDEVGHFKVKKGQVLDYIGYRSYFDSSRDFRQTLLTKKIIHREKSGDVQKWTARSLIRLKYPEDLLNEETTKREYREIVENLSCIDGIALTNKVAVTVHWCQSPKAVDQSAPILKLLSSIEFYN